jgi:disulfide bond formation protein DsbB
MTHLAKARALALGLPAALMAGALGSQYIGGLYPCEMCHWQRWPHDTAIVAALFAFGTRSQRLAYWLVWFAALAILTSGLIGAFHAGVEYGWWPTIEAIMTAPIVRCDVPQWTLFGISLAGFNALLSIGGALVIFTLLSRRKGQA